MFDKFETQIVRHMILRVLMSVEGVLSAIVCDKKDKQIRGLLKGLYVALVGGEGAGTEPQKE
jgi:hypothetical protein